MNDTNNKSQFSTRQRIAALGMPYSTGWRRLREGKRQREALASNEDRKIMWSQLKKKKGYSKVSEQLRKELQEWILDHPSVVPSPITNETLLIADPDNPTHKKRVAKLLLEISIRELHNDLLHEERGLVTVRNEKGDVLISDTALRYLVPEQLRRMTKRHKQMCGCEVCIVANMLQASLLFS
mmetsp:Transcript_5084/g.7971  ORF Transcript_5084/g.7971 Transcript_5084/m.7971 type:complete len:182 (+) Transcript_5084:2-547(+)